MKQYKEGDLLEVGDVVYIYPGSRGPEPITIDRVTNKRAFAGYRQMERELKRGPYRSELTVKVLGNFSVSHAYAPSEELKRQHEYETDLKEAYQLMQRLHYNHINKGNVKQVIEFLNSIINPPQPNTNG